MSKKKKFAVSFLCLVIVDLTFHSGCDFQDERLRSHAPPHLQLEVEEECSEYAFSAIPLYLNNETMSFKRDHLFIVYKHGAG